MSRVNKIKGLSENVKYIAFRLRSPQEFKPDTFRAVRGIYLPYEHFPESMQYEIQGDAMGYTAGFVDLSYDPDSGLHLILIEDSILTIIGAVKDDDSGHAYPQALRFERDKGWKIEKVIEWLSKRFKLEEEV